MKIISFCILVLILSSCSRKDSKTEIESALLGMWTIETLDFTRPQTIRPLTSNILNFNKDSELKFPEAKRVNWFIQKNQDKNYSLILKSEEPEYNNSYKITFVKDSQNKLLKLHLISESIEMVCVKGLYNFDRNENIIDRVVKLTTEK